MSDWTLADIQDNLDQRESDGDGPEVRDITMAATEGVAITDQQKALVKSYVFRYASSLAAPITAILVKVYQGTALSSAEVTAIEAFDPESIIEIRNHVVISLRREQVAGNIPSMVGSTQTSVSYVVGGIWITVNPPGANKFTCVADGNAPIQNPLNYVMRTLTWELYSKWRAAPPGWGL